jgi:hypothetical protein
LLDIAALFAARSDRHMLTCLLTGMNELVLSDSRMIGRAANLDAERATTRLLQIEDRHMTLGFLDEDATYFPRFAFDLSSCFHLVD